MASTIVPGDTNGFSDVFLRDNQTGISERISVDSNGTEANGSSGRASISLNGRFVAFASYASNLVAGDTNGTIDHFLHDRQTKLTTLVSPGMQAGFNLQFSNTAPLVSSDGRYVAFTTDATNLAPVDANGSAFDVFVQDTLQNSLNLVSVSSQGVQGNGASVLRSMTGDGRFVVFSSTSSNLVANDSNGVEDVFVRDRLNGYRLCKR